MAADMVLWNSDKTFLSLSCCYLPKLGKLIDFWRYHGPQHRLSSNICWAT